MEDSRIAGLYRLSLDERRVAVAAVRGMSEESERAWASDGLDESTADRMIENVVGRLALPVGVATNFIIDGRPRLIPFCVEEASIVAAASNVAKRARASGGFRTDVDPPLMIGQIQVVEVDNVEAAGKRILSASSELIYACNDVRSTMIELGGGCKRIEVRTVEAASGPMLVIHLIVDTRDAMGANAVNTMAERIAPRIEALTEGRVLLRILSNLASHRLARASVRFSPSDLESGGENEGALIARDIALAAEFADADPWRATTHNKGIMNAISAIGLACGQDTRAIESGAHAWASMSGRYTSLTKWEVGDEGDLHGSIELPLAVGIVGGASRVHPVARANLELLDVSNSSELAGIMAAAGLAQNLGAMRALVTAGIQKGHMGLHLRNLALAAGADGEEVDRLIEMVRGQGVPITQTVVDDALSAMRS